MTQVLSIPVWQRQRWATWQCPVCGKMDTVREDGYCIPQRICHHPGEIVVMEPLTDLAKAIDRSKAQADN